LDRIAHRREQGIGNTESVFLWERAITINFEKKESAGLTTERAERLDRFFSGFIEGAHPLLLLDYDGTLAAFRVDRFAARPWAGVRQLLKRIQIEGRTRMAVITGRPAAEIAPMLQLDPPLEVWGLHGAERLYPDGRRDLQEAPAATRVKLEELRVLLRRDPLGGLFEDKANGVVLHWRGRSRPQAAQIEQRTRALFEPLARMEGLALLDFDGGIELRVGRNKGGAVREIVAEAKAGAPVAYLGDDLSDEAAFEAVNCLGPRGLSILVRRAQRKTAAQLWLHAPAGVKEFLESWIEAMSSAGLPGFVAPVSQDL
jgi:trehalose-phosphatase